MNLFSSKTINMLEKSVSYSSLKQKVISQNIANATTPNYKAKNVSFKAELERAGIHAHRTNAKHINFKGGSHSNITVKEKKDAAYNHNGNNVDIDIEMAEMAKNQIYYNAVIERLNGKFNGLKEALKGGN